ncbi:MAG: carboxypeptidase regulatory-like domain-containing protein, partial [Planctomycetes bacterium]|nr:carboxypeptidase regulatory-like domain-containing protein [Planctomycetota bacterium]
ARTQLEDGLRVDVGEVKLGPGAELAGIVLDEHDSPIANATVTASLFRQPGANDGTNENGRGRGDGEGGGRRGRGGPPGANEFGRGGDRQTATTHTDAKGRFLLDRVPAAELSISVRHERFVDAKQEPIDPRQQPRVEMRMAHRPAVVGTVVDAATGEPVELFGIRWRREPGGEFRRGAQMLGGRLQEMLTDPARAEEAQRFQDLATQFDAQLRRAQDDRRARLGGAGIVPGSTPKPTTHANGSFRLEDIEPGEFVLDVDAPGYVKVAGGPFQVGTEAVSAPLVVRVERGSALRGKVVSSHTGQSVAGARVTLALPEVQGGDFGAIDGLAGMMRGQRGQGGGPGGGGPFGARGGREVLAQARTDRDGRFELPTLRAGTYSLTIRAEGFPEFRDPELMIGANPGETVLRIDPGAHLFGTVIGLEPGTRATLELSHIENRDRRTVRVDEETHEYSVEGLAAGGWTIQIVGEGDRGSFRQRLGALLGANNGAAPDVVVAAGSEQRHDIDASLAQPAVVEGQVFRNGSPGSGLEVRLVAEIAGAATEATESPFGRMGRGGGRMLRANVGGADGRYRIDSVPPGAYRLEVWERGGGGGRGQGGGGGPRMRSDKALSQMSIEVRKGQSTTFNLTVATGLVHLAVNRSDGTAITRVTVSFALAGEAGELPPEQWSKLVSFRSVSVRGGDVDLGEIPAGIWSYAVTANGAQPLRGTLSVTAGGASRIDGSLAPATENTAANGGR